MARAERRQPYNQEQTKKRRTALDHLDDLLEVTREMSSPSPREFEQRKELWQNDLVPASKRASARIVIAPKEERRQAYAKLRQLIKENHNGHLNEYTLALGILQQTHKRAIEFAKAKIAANNESGQ